MLILPVMVLFFAATGYAQVSPDTTGVFKDISGYLFRLPGGMRSSLTDLDLVPETIRFTDQDDIDSLLSARGIFPNTDAYNLVYRLNPAVNNLNDLQPGTLILPRVRSANALSLQQLRGGGQHLVLFLDTHLRTELQNITSSLRSDLLRGQNWPATTDTGRLRDLYRSIDSSSTTLAATLNDPQNNIVLDKATLTQVRDELALYRSIKHKDTVGSSDLQRLAFLQESLQSRNAVFTASRGNPADLPEAFPSSDVVIQVKDTLGRPFPNLRVFYVPKAFINDPQKALPLPITSNPARGRLPEASYFIWASRPGDPTRLTEQLAILVRKRTDGKPAEFEILQIKPR
jgi:hypothetical protein